MMVITSGVLVAIEDALSFTLKKGLVQRVGFRNITIRVGRRVSGQHSPF